MTAIVRRLLGLAIAAAATSGSAFAQPAYPDRPVKIIVGFAAGSAADLSARVIGEELARTLKQPFVVESRPGASSNIAAESVVRSPPDGYTLYLGSVANTINTSVKKGAFVDIGKDLKPVAMVCSVPNLLVVHPSVQATTVKELIAIAKADPDKLNYGSAGPGTAPHLSAELLKSMAGIKMTHVPYQGTAQAAQDLVGGRLHLMFSPASTVLPQVEAKNLRAIAWSTLKRSAAMPAIPTVAESGLPGFETSIWFGLLAPAGTPDAIRDQLAAAVVVAQKSDAVASGFRKQGIEPATAGPAEFAKYIASETLKWSDVVVKAGLVK